MAYGICGPTPSGWCFTSRSSAKRARSAGSTRRAISSSTWTACSAGSAATASAKRLTATANISIISRCGSTPSPASASTSPPIARRASASPRTFHRPFVSPGRGVIWKMEEDLSAPYPGYGLGAMDAFDGYVSYKLLSEDELASEIAEMRAIMERQYETLQIDQDLGLGMMLWLAHFFPREDWAVVQRQLSLAALDRLWVDPPGYFGRASYAREVRIAFANYGVSLGLQAQDQWPERVQALND